MGLLLETLSSVDVLAGQPREVVERFMVLGRSTTKAKGQVLWRAGDPPRGVVVPLTGHVKTRHSDEHGREVIESLRTSGDVLGLASALDGLPHASDAVVTRPGEFFSAAAHAVRGFLDAHPSAREAAWRLIGRRLRRSVREREALALLPVPQRVARLLVAHACVLQDDGARILLSATQAEIAARLGTVREVAARALARLQSAGAVEKTPNGLFVSDWDALCRAAGVEPGSPELELLLATGGPPAERRTARYFLPMAEPRRAGADRDSERCAEHLGDLSACRAAGCAGAIAGSSQRAVDGAG